MNVTCIQGVLKVTSNMINLVRLWASVKRMTRILCFMQYTLAALLTAFQHLLITWRCAATMVLPIAIKRRHDQDNLQLCAGHAHFV